MILLNVGPSDNNNNHLLYSLLVTACLQWLVSEALELTFELPDNANQCYFEDIKKDTECTIEFQVVTGGQYDVDMKLTSPSGQILYQDVRKQYDSHSWKADTTGPYQVCFSNEFSTFSHKIVYMDWQIGDEKPLLSSMETHLTAMTMMESSSNSVHERLKVIDDYQTHHRLREATGRKRAEELNERVLWWSVGQTAVIFLIGIGQVLVLRSFFTDKRSGIGPM